MPFRSSFIALDNANSRVGYVAIGRLLLRMSMTSHALDGYLSGDMSYL